MAFPGTHIEVDGPASDDIGWLNAGAEIVVRGNAGNGAANAMLEAGYTGKLIPVNPKAEEILGLPVTHSIEDLPEGIDLAVIVVPVAAVVPSMSSCKAVARMPTMPATAMEPKCR